MKKPLTVACTDFNRQLTELINTSGLPAFLIAYELKKIITQLEKIAAQQYQADLNAYQTALKRGKRKGEKE